MTVKQRIEVDLKEAMLAADKQLVTVLRGIKSEILNAEVDQGSRDVGLDDYAATKLLLKEAKKRTEAAELYKGAGDRGRAQSELLEKKIIEKYLPDQLSEDQLTLLVDKALTQFTDPTMKDMGAIIGEVISKAGPGADGGMISKIVKEKIS